MAPHRRLHRLRTAVLAVAAAAALVGAVTGGGVSQAAGTGPCDIYAAGGTPCVAAHSTTRALYGSYNGALYQVRRSSDNTTRNIGLLAAGDYVDASQQDSFCAGTTCLITIIYDQSGRGNHLTQAPPGGFSGPAAGGYDNLANATAAPIMVGGHKAYGVYVSPGTGYRNNATNGVAKGDQPEGMYAIFDGTHYNGGCCFDYGNAETNSRDNGNGTMEAIYFGNIKVWGYGTGNGPWIMADLENGLFSGVNAGYNSNDPTINYRFTTAIVKGEPNHWSIRGGNAQSGSLSTFYNGARPNVSGYNPMKKEGAIILGIGGDNSIGAAGTFYEGVMTSGYPSDATENSVQANLVAAAYSPAAGGRTGPIVSGLNSSKCMDNNNAAATNGNKVQMWDCNGYAAAQSWTVNANGTITIGGGCLDITGANYNNGTLIEWWACNGGANQQWQASSGRLVNPASGKCLDDPGSNTANGTQLVLWACNGGSNQQWRLP
ncbi:MAG: alpha-L-arabinofuranosidase [Hamadaea sp.]|uniref:arabinofuranosidase catalytic domain-containing protein n=1 Tax=Hamadaea sp. TaxID=2024425 RepID=UPI00181A6CE1|nr:arabinofuranosidase catalytic domain-containing protein [Hamadaea sp.]NUT21088.1 alpha-L-arabinofuranosidase [Hamadaea sp.]